MLGQAPSPALRIVVLEGENAVNIIQQKTAVRPLVEVRDRNNVPVSGATVTFTIGGGQPAAFAGGAQTLTVTTNTAGQAAASGFNVAGAGKIQVQVQAAFQGQVASATITQTAFATAAAATAAVAATTGAAAGGATGATAAGAAAGTGAAVGGGLPLTTIAIIGAAAGGGVIAATQTGLLGGDVSYTGPLSGQYVWTNRGSTDIGTPVVCAYTRSITGSMTLELNGEGSSGRGTLSMTHTDLSVAGDRCNPNPSPPLDVRLSGDFAVSGGPSALAVTHTEQSNQSGVVRMDNYTFTGSLSGNTITGTLSWNTRSQTSAGGNTFTGTGAFTIPVTLQR
jgi:hypothetical protein